MTNRNYNYQNRTRNHDRFGVGNHKRECFRTKGNQFFEKTFNDENYCKNYLNKVKANAKYPFYYKVENNENGTQTLRLFKVKTWYE